MTKKSVWQNMITENGKIEISTADFEKALDKLDPKHCPHSVTVEYHRAQSLFESIRFTTPDLLKLAKNYKTNDAVNGELFLRINGVLNCKLDACYLPESCEKNPAKQDLILCFHPDRVKNSRFLKSVLAKAKKLHEKENADEIVLE